MSRRFLLSLSACLLLTTVGGAQAAQFNPKMNKPKSYKEAKFGVQEVRDNVGTVDCGGWATDATTGSDPATGTVHIPTISPDLPGRDNVSPLGNPTGGIGIRGDFEFPDSTWGYLSTCNIYQGKMYDADIAYQCVSYELEIADESDPNSALSIKIVPGTPSGTSKLNPCPGSGYIDINPKGWCLKYDKATPGWCKKLYEWFQMLSASMPHFSATELCTDTCPPLTVPPAAYCENALYCPVGNTDKHYCFDEPFTRICYGQECRTIDPCGEACCPPRIPYMYNEVLKCTWGTPVYHTDADGNVICDGLVPDEIAGDYEDYTEPSSFYRHYAVDYKVPAITVSQSDGARTWQLRAECYEYYRENDPKECVTDMWDEQCEFVIASPDEQAPWTPEWIAGEHRQKEEYRPSPGLVADAPRRSRPAPDPWVPDTETNLNLIDAKKMRDIQKKFEDPNDITGIIGTILTTKQTGSKSVPDYARTDMFDDTAERVMSEYWEAQAQELLKMVAEPTTKLVMPVRWFVGFAVDDPLYQYVRKIVSRSDGVVEITLRAGPDDLGNVLLSFAQTLIAPVQAVRIPLVVPLASEEEINGRIFGWRQWKQQEDTAASGAGRASYSGDADPLITKLEQYRDAIRKERLMRGALTKYLTRLFQKKSEIYRFFVDWFTANADAIRAIRQSEDRMRLKWIWRLLQQSMLQADECQLQWCSNMRYSPPVYSLLDEWWGDVPWWYMTTELRDLNYVPDRDLRDLGYEAPPDQVFDFSQMGFSTGGLLIPVLWPVQVKLNLPTPPDIGVKPPPPDTFPDLPGIPDENIFDSFPVPDVNTPGAPIVSAPPGPDLNEAMDILREFREMIDGTDKATQMVEEEAAIASGQISPAGGPWNDRTSMRGSYCRFIPSIMIPPDPEDRHGYPAKIVHIENDLRERLARLFSRWMPETTADYSGRVMRLNQDFPNPDDMKCREDVHCNPLSPEITITTVWQWYVIQDKELFTTLGDQLYALTCPFCGDATNPPDETKNPYLDTTAEVLKRIFPRLPLPILIPLIPSPPPPTP